METCKCNVKQGDKYCVESYWYTLATFVSYISLVPFYTLKKTNNQPKQKSKEKTK